jgi:hypothetical protein
VLAASGSLEMVQALAGASESERWLAVEALGGLVDRSLVQTTHHDPPRYRMLDTPRSLARQRLVQAGEWDEVSRRRALAIAQLDQLPAPMLAWNSKASRRWPGSRAPR